MPEGSNPASRWAEVWAAVWWGTAGAFTAALLNWEWYVVPAYTIGILAWSGLAWLVRSYRITRREPTA